MACLVSAIPSLGFTPIITVLARNTARLREDLYVEAISTTCELHRSKRPACYYNYNYRYRGPFSTHSRLKFPQFTCVIPPALTNLWQVIRFDIGECIILTTDATLRSSFGPRAHSFAHPAATPLPGIHAEVVVCTVRSVIARTEYKYWPAGVDELHLLLRTYPWGPPPHLQPYLEALESCDITILCPPSCLRLDQHWWPCMLSQS